LQRGSAERFDPEGCNSPEGEWRSGRRQAVRVVEAATGLSGEVGRYRKQTGKSVAERRTERAAEAAGRKRSGRPGTLTLEWDP
jgi:hypothetical protein